MVRAEWASSERDAVLLPLESLMQPRWLWCLALLWGQGLSHWIWWGGGRGGDHVVIASKLVPAGQNFHSSGIFFVSATIANA